jgi:hypothetical protein
MGGGGEGAARQTDDELEVDGGAGESRGVGNEAPQPWCCVRRKGGTSRSRRKI